MNRDQLHSLYVSYGYAVHRRCLRILGSKADADDVLQEVFMRAMKYGESFDGTNALGWLYRIADTQCFEVLKKKRRSILFSAVAGGEAFIDHVGSNGAEARMESPTQGPLAQKLIAAADPKDARIALLYFVDGMTQDEVAAEIPCSRKTVKKRLARFKELAKRLGATLAATVTAIILRGGFQ